MYHITTDPACHFHVPPTTWLARRRFNKARGVGCPRCLPGKHLVDANRNAIYGEILLSKIMAEARTLDRLALANYAGNSTIREAWLLQGYRRAIGDLLRALADMDTGAPLVTFNISSPSEREQ